MERSTIERLDESVICLSMLGSRPSVQKSQRAVRNSLSETEAKWCSVLDELSWLCDYRTGGKTVTSIAAQSNPTGNIFWFATNRGLQLPVKRHVQWLLQELHTYAVSDRRNAHEMHSKLFRRSVAFNHRRVESYHDRLSSLLACVDLQSNGQNDLSLTARLEKLVDLRDNHHELCYSAFELRGNALGVQLKRNIRIPRIGSIWRAIRHYIGRLGSWWSACTVLIAAVEMDATIFLNCQAKAVPDGGLMAAALSSHDQVSDRQEVASRLARRQDETYVHAELLVLNLFYQRDLAFAENVAYIGCSKLSCYCCHIYTNLHPLTVISRPCHGNTWTRWAMPVLRDDKHGENSDQNTRLLTEMLDRMQQEIETGVSAGVLGRHLESTTGLSEERTIQHI